MWDPVKIQKKGYTPKHTKLKNRQGQQVHDRMRAETFADYYEYEHWAEDIVDRPEITDTPIHPLNEEVETGDIDIQELEEAVGKLRNNKAPCPDEVPPELTKWLDSESGKVILELLNDCWNKESLTKDMNDARLAIIYKKGCTDVPQNYRPIALLNVIYKLLASIIQKRISSKMDGVLDKK